MSHIDSGGDPNSIHAGRELADISISALWKQGLYLVIVCVAVWFAMAGFFKLVIGQLNGRDAEVSSLARPSGELPPEPRLLTNEPLNLRQFQAQESQRMQGYGFVDQAAGTVHVPIDRAKELLLQQGLPVRVQAAPAPAPAAPSTGGH